MSRNRKFRSAKAASDLHQDCLSLLMALDNRSPHTAGGRIAAIGGYAVSIVETAWAIVAEVLDEGFASFLEEVAREIRYAMSVAIASDVDGEPLGDHNRYLWNCGLHETYYVLNWRSAGDLNRTTDQLRGFSGPVYSAEYIRWVDEEAYRLLNPEPPTFAVRPEVHP